MASSAIVGCMKITTNWFPVDKFALLLGLTVSVGMSCAVIGAAPLATFLESHSWRDTMMYFSIIGFVFFFFSLFVSKTSLKVKTAARRMMNQKSLLAYFLKV